MKDIGLECGEAYIWYLFHSGFAVKTREHFLIFDYYPASRRRNVSAGLDNGVIDPAEISGLDVAVFSSHNHPDHFDPIILEWQKKISKVKYILSYDIPYEKGADNILSVYPGKNYDFSGIHLEVLDSTDIGSAFLLQTGGLAIFHAGDLNWWHWNGEPDEDNLKMAEDYKKIIGSISGKRIDIAFLPLDPRLDENYLLGLDYFVKSIDTGWIFPMHFGKNYSVFEQLQNDGRTTAYRAKIMGINRRGQLFKYKSG